MISGEQYRKGLGAYEFGGSEIELAVISDYAGYIKHIGESLEDIPIEKQKEYLNLELTLINPSITKLSNQIDETNSTLQNEMADLHPNDIEYQKIKLSYCTHALNCCKDMRSHIELLKRSIENWEQSVLGEIQNFFTESNLLILKRYFLDYSSIAWFHRVILSLSLMEDGKLREKQTGKLIAVFLAACEKGLTKEPDYSEKKLREIIMSISDAYGVPVVKDTVYRRVKNRDLNFYELAFKEFDNLAPH